MDYIFVKLLVHGTRTDDLAAGSNAAGMFTFVEQGTVNADNGFVCTSNSGSVRLQGTNNLVVCTVFWCWSDHSRDGLDKSGNTLSVDLKG